MQTIQYTITFHSDWHCGSGLAAGADVDALAIKDKDNLPFIPGKTLKGLIRQAVEELVSFGYGKVDKGLLEKTFGKLSDDDEKANMKQGVAFFSNAELEDLTKKYIIQQQLQDYFYRNIASTAIDPTTGIAKDHSLRKVEVCAPCVLHAYISNVPDEMVELITEGMKFIKRLGVNRNRGLGRCTITDKK